MAKKSQSLPDQIFSPVVLDQFFDSYWESQPLHIERSKEGYFSNILALEQLEELLSSRDLYFPMVQLSRVNSPIPVDAYVDSNNKILPLRLIQLHQAGATIIVSEAHRAIASVANLCRQLQRALHMRCQANLYLSDTGSQGLNAHYDTHDVLVLQISGQKVFNFYSRGVELPFNSDRFNPEFSDNGSLDVSVTLQAGDSLYIPRGMRHDAVACGDQPSLHITVGLYPYLVRDLLQEAVQVVAEKNPELRRSIPRELLMPKRSKINAQNEAAVEATALFLEEAVSVESIAEALSRLRDEIVVLDSPDCSQLLTRPPGLSPVSLKTSVSIASMRIHNWERQGQRLKLRVTGQVLEFEEPLSTAVEWLLALEGDSPVFTIGEIPGLDSDQAIALAERLLDENVLIRCG